METDVPSELLPCAICARTFMPESLAKHVKICERAVTKKRKPFDSAKQRIQGTDLAEFLPRQERKKSIYEERHKSSWKETHDDFLRTIRAARGRTTDASSQVKQAEQAGQRQSSSHASSGVPMRANEKGTCPTCNRRFGVKAYERHVAWCKERSTRLPNPLPATNNLAKERLEARMKYRAPMLKNRRANNREKYSQSSASAPNIVPPIAKTTTPTEPIRSNASRSTVSRTRETLSVGDARRIDKSSESQRSNVTATGRGEPAPQAQNSTETIERTNTAKRSSHLTSSDKVHGVEGNTIKDRKTTDINGQTVNTARKARASSPSRSRKASHSIIARTRSESKVNDITVNENVLGMLVRPCNITHKDDKLITWEKISRDRLEYHSHGDRIKNDAPRKNEDYLSIEEETPPCDLMSTTSSVENSIGNIAWSSAVRKLNRTYLIKDSVDHDPSDDRIIDDREYIPIQHSPRVEFHVIESANLNCRNDSTSIYEDNCSSEIVEKNDNGDVFLQETNGISEEKNLICQDTKSVQSEPNDEKDSLHDEFPLTSGIDLIENECKYENGYENECKYENGYENEVQLKQKNEEKVNERNQKFSEEPCNQEFCEEECNQKFSEEPYDREFSEEPYDQEFLEKPFDQKCSQVPCNQEISKEPCNQEFSEEPCDQESPEEPCNQKFSEEPYDQECSEEPCNQEFSEEPYDQECSEEPCNQEFSEETYDQECSEETYNQKFSEEPHKKNVISETCEFEENFERIESPVPSCSYLPEIRINSYNKQNALPEEFRYIKALECISEISSNNSIEVEKPKKLEDNSSLVECPNENDSRYDEEYIDQFDIRTNAKNFINCNKDSIKENYSESIEVHNIEDNIEETRFITISDSRVKLERPLPIPIPIHRLNLIRIDSKIQKNLNLLRGSTDTLISSVEAVDLANGKRSNELHRNSSEEENTNDPYRHSHSDRARILPVIKTDRDTTFFRERSPKNSRNYWEKVSKFSNGNLLPQDYRHNRLRKRNPKIRILPPVLIDHSPRMQSGANKDYDPFLLAERQMHDLLLSDSSDLSTTLAEEGSSERARKGSTKRRESLYPISHSSAFVNYPSHNKISSTGLDKRSTIDTNATSIGEFEELASDFSSDSTETNSLSREIFLRDFHDSSKERDRQKEDPLNNRTRGESSKRELGRRMILDKSIALGNEIVQEGRSNRNERRVTNVKLKPSKVLRSLPNRSQPIRAYSAPKSIYERKNKTTDGGNRDDETLNNEKRDRANVPSLDNDRKNDYITLSSSDLSLSSIVSSEVDIKRSNSVFDELITSFEDDVLGNDSFPSLRSLLRNESLRAFDDSPVHGPGNRQQHGDRISDEEYSSPDNYKQQEQKFNTDSAYSSLNRKSNYSNHGRSTNDGSNRFEDNSSRNNRRENQITSISAGKTKCRMSRFCHECGSKFPETAKFCCQCGVKRLTL